MCVCVCVCVCVCSLVETKCLLLVSRLRDSMMTACAHHTQAVQEREKLKSLQVRGRQTASSLSTSGSRHHDNSSTNGPCASVRSSSSAKIAQSPLESVQDGGVSTPPQPSGKKSENPPLEVDIEAVEELIKKMKTGVGKVRELGVSFHIVCN